MQVGIRLLVPLPKQLTPSLAASVNRYQGHRATPSTGNSQMKQSLITIRMQEPLQTPPLYFVLSVFTCTPLLLRPGLFPLSCGSRCTIKVFPLFCYQQALLVMSSCIYLLLLPASSSSQFMQTIVWCHYISLVPIPLVLPFPKCIN